jgi:hypothetical protein
VFGFSIAVIAENGVHTGVRPQKAVATCLLIARVPSVRLSYNFETQEETKPET